MTEIQGRKFIRNKHVKIIKSNERNKSEDKEKEKKRDLCSKYINKNIEKREQMT